MKHTLLYPRRQLLLFLLAFTALFFCNIPYSKAQQPGDVAIEIVSADAGTGVVTLNPAGTVWVYAGKKVTWSVAASASNVSSFIIEKKERSPQIFFFLDRPSSERSRRGGGRVDWFRRNAVYEYSIIWYDAAGIKHEYDPKIAVKPSGSVMMQVIIAFCVGVLALLTISYLRRKRGAR